MENITYYFAQNKEAKSLNQIISDPLFNKLVTYFTERKGQEVILRQIKIDIPTDSNLELFLDKLIKYNLVERKNRRYSLTFPIYSSTTEPSHLPITLEELIEVNTKEDVAYFFGEQLWALLFEEEKETYFFGIRNASKGLPLMRRVEEGDDALRFVSIFPDNLIPLDLANYFYFLSRRQVLPQQFERLQSIIGDVDIHYFIPQILKVFRTIKRSKSRVGKKNIFQDVLIETNDLTKNTDGELVLATVFLNDSEALEENNMAMDKLRIELNALYDTVEDKNQRIFFKMQLYSRLIHKFIPEKEYIR